MYEFCYKVGELHIGVGFWPKLSHCINYTKTCLNFVLHQLPQRSNYIADYIGCGTDVVLFYLFMVNAIAQEGIKRVNLLPFTVYEVVGAVRSLNTPSAHMNHTSLIRKLSWDSYTSLDHSFRIVSAFHQGDFVNIHTVLNDYNGHNCCLCKY